MATGLLESIDRSTQLAGHNRLALLLFQLDGRVLFGINVFKVQEVITRPRLNWMPGAHPLVAGVAELRGRMVPVIDLAQAIGQDGGGAAAHVIVTEFNRSVQGFLVRAVDRIIHVDVEAVMPPPGGEAEGSYLTAITRHQDELVEIIDVEKVLADVVGERAGLSNHLVEQARALKVPKRILVADDSRVARNQIERVLSQLGIDCILVNNGREALATLREMAAGQGDLNDSLLMVISDVEMPDIDGYTLTTEIRRDPRLRNLFVMLHTSLSGVFNNAMVEKVGADRFLAKFKHDDLAQSVLERLQVVAQQVH